MARVHEPGNTMSPARSRTPKLSTLRASHATAVTGLPSTASLRPLATTSPLRVSTASIAVMSMSVGANRAAPFFHVVPVFGSIMAIAFLGEHPQAFHIIGFALVLTGVFVASRKPKPR